MIFQIRHVLAALLLHGLLLALLTGGVQCSRKQESTVVIRATLLDPSRKQVAEQKRQDKLAEEKRRKEQKEQKEQEEKKKADEARKRQEEEQRQKAEQQKKQQAWEARQKADKKKKEDDARRQKELEEEKRKAAELAKKKRAEEEQQDLAQAMAQEDQQREQERADQAREQRDQQQQAERNAKLAQWAGVLADHIEKKWNRPSVPGQFPCKIHVQLLPDGTVTDAKVVNSCGNPTVDRSIVDAAYRSSPMPRPEDPTVFDRDLDITFDPKQ